MESPSIPFSNIKYPILGEGKWHNTEFSAKDKLAGIVFSKTYLSFLLDVSITLTKEGAYSVQGRVFSFKRDEKGVKGYELVHLGEKKQFAGPDGYNLAMAYAVRECDKIESVADKMKPEPLFAHYPQKNRGDWQITRSFEEGGKKIELAFSKQYKGLLLDVIIVNEGSGYYVKGRVFDPREGNKCKYDSAKQVFSGPKAYENAVISAGNECLEVEKAVDFFLAKK